MIPKTGLVAGGRRAAASSPKRENPGLRDRADVGFARLRRPVVVEMTSGAWASGLALCPAWSTRPHSSRGTLMRVLCSSVPTGLPDNAQLPVREPPFRSVGSIAVAQQHLGGVCEVGPEEAAGPSAPDLAWHGATGAGQGLGKGRPG